MPPFTNASVTNFASAENRNKMTGALEFVRRDFGRKYPLLIGGNSVSTDKEFVSFNPSHHSQIVGRIAEAAPADVDRAVAAATHAFPDWSGTRAFERAALLSLLEAAVLIRERRNPY